MLVLDASVAIKWFKEEPGSDIAERVALSGDLVAPDLLLVEVGNAGWRAVRMGLMRREQTFAIPTALRRYIGEFRPIEPLVPRALAIAHMLDHPLYDCVYLALAESLARPVITADRRLLARVANTAWGASVHPLASFA